MCWFVDGDVSVDRHADDDVHGARHEGVYHREHHVRLEEGRGIVSSADTFGDIKERRNGGQEDTEVGDCQAQEVHVHDPLQVRPRQHHQVQQVANQAHPHYDVRHHGVGHKLDLKDGGGRRVGFILVHVGSRIQQREPRIGW